MLEKYIWFLPPLMAGVSAIATMIQLPRWRDARYVKHPDRAFWGFWHILDSSEFTEEGRALRSRYFLHAIRFVLFGLAGAGIARIVSAQ